MHCSTFIISDGPLFVTLVLGMWFEKFKIWLKAEDIYFKKMTINSSHYTEIWNVFVYSCYEFCIVLPSIGTIAFVNCNASTSLMGGVRPENKQHMCSSLHLFTHVLYPWCKKIILCWPKVPQILYFPNIFLSFLGLAYLTPLGCPLRFKNCQKKVEP